MRRHTGGLLKGGSMFTFTNLTQHLRLIEFVLTCSLAGQSIFHTSGYKPVYFLLPTGFTVVE